MIQTQTTYVGAYGRAMGISKLYYSYITVFTPQDF